MALPILRHRTERRNDIRTIANRLSTIAALNTALVAGLNFADILSHGVAIKTMLFLASTVVGFAIAMALDSL